MKSIAKAAWDGVLEKTCDVANSTRADDDPMYGVYSEQMVEILDELEAEFGTQSRILDTRADYIDDPCERRQLYKRALELARQSADEDEIETILQSLRDLDDDLRADAEASDKKSNPKDRFGR